MQGLFIGVGGYNDKLDVLLQHVLDRVKSLEIKPDRLSVMKEEVRILRLCELGMLLIHNIFF